LLARYVIDARAVSEVAGIELEEAVAAIQAEHPDMEVEEAVAIAADQAEELLESEQARAEPAAIPRELPLVGGRLVPTAAWHSATASDTASRCEATWMPRSWCLAGSRIGALPKAARPHPGPGADPSAR
jgi:uncharacterized protein (UPF0262 family)